MDAGPRLAPEPAPQEEVPEEQSPPAGTAQAPVSTNLPGAPGGPIPDASLGAGPGGCSTVLAVLQSQSSLSTWTRILGVHPATLQPYACADHPPAQQTSD